MLRLNVAWLVFVLFFFVLDESRSILFPFESDVASRLAVYALSAIVFLGLHRWAHAPILNTEGDKSVRAESDTETGELG